KAGGSKATSKPAARGTPDMTSLVDLPPETVKLLAKPRDGYEEHFDTLLALYEDHAGELGALTMAPDELRARRQRFQELGPEREAAQRMADTAAKHLEMVDETRLLQASRMWTGMLEIYNKARASKDPAVKSSIAAFGAFMATGPRKKKDGGEK